MVYENSVTVSQNRLNDRKPNDLILISQSIKESVSKTLLAFRTGDPLGDGEHIVS